MDEDVGGSHTLYRKIKVMLFKYRVFEEILAVYTCLPSDRAKCVRIMAGELYLVQVRISIGKSVI